MTNLQDSSARAFAHSNIALVKYWGKADVASNLPAVPSLSMTLDGMYTETVVTFDPTLDQDVCYLDNRPSRDKEQTRFVKALDLVRREANIRTKARVKTRNNFPTASGLASSASGFAALILAARAAARLPMNASTASDLARQCSASAARSIFGGFVALPLSQTSAVRVATPDGFQPELLVAVTTSAEKSMGSTAGMQHTKDTSPYYAPWVEQAPRLYAEACTALRAGDLAVLGPLVEHSALLMHASMWGANPALIYFNDVTMRVIHAVRTLRERGLTGYFTMDAGPHVKVLTSPSHAAELSDHLARVEGVQRVLRCKVGPDARVEVGELEFAANSDSLLGGGEKATQ
jgi:diphosphomevalonate decarboxylase